MSKIHMQPFFASMVDIIRGSEPAPKKPSCRWCGGTGERGEGGGGCSWCEPSDSILEEDD